MLYPSERARYDRALIERYSAKIRFAGEDECWLWLAARIGGRGKEYGSFNLPRWFPSRGNYAHRFGFCLAHGLLLEEIKGEEIMHSCDTPLCQNARHLRKGTHGDNVRDMHAKRRWRLRTAKLTASDIPRIRERLAAGELHHDIAKDYGVSRSTISLIRSGRNWKGVTELIESSPILNPPSARRR